jgi:hypothetical protein
VAVHGKNFTKAARDTWNMFRDERVDVLINDDLTGAVLFTGCIVGGGVTALVAGIWTFATHRNLTVGIAIVSFFIGYFLVRETAKPDTPEFLSFGQDDVYSWSGTQYKISIIIMSMGFSSALNKEIQKHMISMAS